MSTCLERFNNTLVGSANTTWGQVDRETLSNISYVSYLRPDHGGALFPWAYTLLFLIVHLPVVLIRVARFDSIQWFCIASALFTVYLTLQEYISTGFAASKVLLWTPLLLVIDAGAMLQVFFLVIESTAFRVGQNTYIIEPGEGPARGVLPQSEPLINSLRSKFGVIQRRIKSYFPKRKRSHEKEIQLQPPQNQDNQAQIQGEAVGLLPTQNQNDQAQNQGEAAELLPPQNQNNQAQNQGEAAASASSQQAVFAATISAILFLVILALQLAGLHASWFRRSAGNPPPVTWCSPIFQPFGIAIMDGDCHIYDIEQHDWQGIGCIKIQGQWQQQWLFGSGVGTILCIIGELVDMILLALVNAEWKVNHIKMKRPWSTMILGVIALGVTLIYGMEYASTLPPGITQHVLVVLDAGRVMAFEGSLRAAGLRGTVLGWSDGLFQSWGTAYFG